MSLRWWYRLFRTSLPLTGRTNNYSRTSHQWENSRVWSTHRYHRNQDRLHEKNKRSSCTLTTLPLSQASAAPHREVSPEPLVPSVGKRAGETTNPDPSIAGCLKESLLRSHTTGIAGESSGLSHWESDCDEEGGGACNNQHTDLGRLSSYLRCPHSNPNQLPCSSAELSQGCALTRKFRGVQICLIHILKWGVWIAPEQFAHAQARIWNTTPCTAESVFGPIWPEGLATTPGSCAAGRADHPQSKTGVEQPHVIHRQGHSFITKAESSSSQREESLFRKLRVSQSYSSPSCPGKGAEI